MIETKPNLLKRISIALGVFRDGYPRSVKQSPFLWPAMRQGVPQWQITDFNSYITDGFQLNTLIYSAIMYKVRAAYYAPLRAYDGDPDHPEVQPLDHPLAALTHRPNPYQSGAQFMGANTVYLNVAGNSYVMLDRPRKGALPTAMYPLRPDRVFIIPGDREIKGYVYVPEGRGTRDGLPILPEDMIHVRLPNPADPLEGMGYGLSPFAAMARSADVDNAVTNYLKMFFQRGTAMNVYLKFDVPMDDSTISQVKHRFQEIYGGYEKWSDVGVIDQGGEIKQFGQNFKEMGFEAIDDRNESRVLGPFGVPGILIGTRLGVNRAINANAKELRQMFWEDTMLPELGLHEAEYQYYLRSDDGSYVMFDTSKVPALRKDIAQTVNAWSQLVSLGVPKNTASEVVGLELGTLPDGDTVYMPLNLIPMGVKPPAATVANEAAVPDAANPASTEGKERQLKAGYTPEQKAALWKVNDRTAAKWEPRFADAAVKSFNHDKREILALVTEAKKKAQERKASIAWQDSYLSVEDYINSAGEDNWRSTFAPLMQGVITEQGKRWAADLGMTFDVRNFFAEDWFDKYTLVFAQQINQTTLDTLGTMFKQAQQEGWSVPEMQKHLTTLFDQWAQGAATPEDFAWYTSRMPPYRTETIARTETIRSSNAGTQELFSEWGVKQHEWLSTRDDRVRNSQGIGQYGNSEFDHLAADGQVQDIDAPFDISGGMLMYPGDPAGSPGNTINCVIGSTDVLPIGAIQAATVREYTGEIIKITAASGICLTVTPNHPILTRRGFIAARFLNQGDDMDDMIGGFLSESIGFSSEPDVNNRPTSIKEIHRSLSIPLVSQRVIDSPMNFHGDGGNGDVNIITTERILSDRFISAPLKHRKNTSLLGADLPGFELIANSAALSSDLDDFWFIALERSRNVGGLSIGASLRGSHLAHLGSIGVASPAWIDTSSDKARANGSSSKLEDFRKLLLAYAVQIRFDKIIDINIDSFSGHVYNLQTESGMFIANGIITHNCRCTVLPVME